MQLLSYMSTLRSRPTGRLVIREYSSAVGANPFRAWLASLDMRMRARIQARILRFELGNLGDHKPVGGGVIEARLFFGPGYRVYFGRMNETLIVVLAGGTKHTQRADVRTAREHWRDYLEAMADGSKK